MACYVHPYVGLTCAVWVYITCWTRLATV